MVCPVIRSADKTCGRGHTLPGHAAGDTHSQGVQPQGLQPGTHTSRECSLRHFQGGAAGDGEPGDRHFHKARSQEARSQEGVRSGTDTFATRDSEPGTDGGARPGTDTFEGAHFREGPGEGAWRGTDAFGGLRPESQGSQGTDTFGGEAEPGQGQARPGKPDQGQTLWRRKCLRFQKLRPILLEIVSERRKCVSLNLAEHRREIPLNNRVRFIGGTSHTFQSVAPAGTHRVRATRPWRWVRQGRRR